MPFWLTTLVGFAKKLWDIKLFRYAVIAVAAALALKAWGYVRYRSGYSAGKAEVEEAVAAQATRLAIQNSLLQLKHAAELKAAKERWENQTRSITDYVQAHPALPDCRLGDDGLSLVRDLYPAQGGVRQGRDAASGKPAAASKRRH